MSGDASATRPAMITDEEGVSRSSSRHRTGDETIAARVVIGVEPSESGERAAISQSMEGLEKILPPFFSPHRLMPPEQSSEDLESASSPP